jgi:glutathione S-transferase
MKIHGANLSPFVRKVLAVATIKGIDFEHEMVFPGSDDPAYRKLSPLGKIPALEDGDLGISDSSVICEYLEETYPEISVLPVSAADRARCRWIEEFADSRWVECTAVFFFENFVKKLMGLGEPDLEKLADVENNVLPQFADYVESIVPDEGFFFDYITVADIALTNPTINAGYGGLTLDAARWPKSVAYFERVKAHPVMVQLMEAEKAMLG